MFSKKFEELAHITCKSASKDYNRQGWILGYPNENKNVSEHEKGLVVIRWYAQYRGDMFSRGLVHQDDLELNEKATDYAKSVRVSTGVKA